MSLASSADLQRLREIGWSLWDPVGLQDTDCPRDEYDKYLLHSVRLFGEGKSRAEVAAYLEDIACDYIGMGPSTAASLQASHQTADHIANYVEQNLKR